MIEVKKWIKESNNIDWTTTKLSLSEEGCLARKNERRNETGTTVRYPFTDRQMYSFQISFNMNHGQIQCF